jgi:hypothetical protein
VSPPYDLSNRSRLSFNSISLIKYKKSAGNARQITDQNFPEDARNSCDRVMARSALCDEAISTLCVVSEGLVQGKPGGDRFAENARDDSAIAIGFRGL